MLDKLLRQWLHAVRRRQDIAESTKALYLRVGSKLIAWPATDDVAAAITGYAEARRRTGIAPRTLALELRVLSVGTRWAERQLGAAPPPRLPHVRVDPRAFAVNHRTPTPEEAAAAIRAMPVDDWRLLARLIATTGARVGEIIALRSQDLDLSARRVALGATEGASKTGIRWFPLDAATMRSLAGREGHGPAPVLDLQGRRAPIQAFGSRLRRACEAAGVPRFTPHGLRRMVIGRLLGAHVDAATAASLTGHSVEVMLKHYRDVTEEDRRLAAEQAMLGVLDELPHGP